MKTLNRPFVRFSHLAATTAIALAATLALEAQPNPARTGTTGSSMNQTERTGNLGNAAVGNAALSEAARAARHASDIIGLNVKNLQDENIGSVEDIVVDLESGRVIAVVISSGGFLGMGNQLSVVPPRGLRHDITKKELRLDITRDALLAAPRFEKGKKPDYNQDAYSGYFQDSNRDGRNRDDRSGVDRLDRADNTSLNTSAGTLDTVDQGNRKADREITSRTGATGSSMNQMERTENSGNAAVGNAALGTAAQAARHASDIIGLNVKNLQDENLGSVEDIVVDLESGRVIAVVLSSGGFLGMGNELSVVSPRGLRHDIDKKELRLNITRDALLAAPRFEKGKKPDYNQESYSGYFQDSNRDDRNRDDRAGVDRPDRADNTSRNARTGALDAMDQGSSKAERETTARIRSAIVDRDGLSTNAQNIKIITRGSQVTLVGAVVNNSEKSTVENIARQNAGSAIVDSQLVVTAR